MRFNSTSAQVMRKAARGPAAIALRQSRMIRPQPVNPRAAVLVNGGSRGVMRVPARAMHPLAGLGGLGDTTGPSTSTQIQTAAKGAGISIGSAAAGAATAGSLASAGAIAGSAVPIVGTAIGAAIGIIAGMLLKKNYLNVSDMNAHEDAEVAIFRQYQPIMGKAPGRAYGLDAMTAIAKGMLHSQAGWTKNNVRQCFHNGCSKYPGNASWIDALVGGGGKPDPDTFPVAIKSWKPKTGVPAAKDFIDNVIIPVNKAHGTWVVPTNSTDRTVLYDLADAYLAKVMPDSIPYVVNAPAPAITTVPTPPVVVGSNTTGGAYTTGPAATGNTPVTPTAVPTAQQGTTTTTATPGSNSVVSSIMTNPLPLILAALAIFKG
jgi:hypothetical protein